jgi:hypothetical protein
MDAVLIHYLYSFDSITDPLEFEEGVGVLPCFVFLDADVGYLTEGDEKGLEVISEVLIGDIWG